MKNESCNIRKKRTVQLIVVFAIGLVFCGSGCNTINPKLQDEYIRTNINQEIHVLFDEYRQSVQKFMADEKIQGSSIALVDGDGILWSAGFGHTDRDHKKPVTTETIFAAMSITKVFTATTVMFAMQEGLVELDTPITDFRHICDDKFLQQVEQAINFIAGAAPVLCRETVECYILYGVLVEVVNHALHVFCSRPVAVKSGQSTPFRPTAVTVRDKGYMAGQLG